MEIFYIPSKLNEKEKTEIEFMSNTIGNWKFLISGRGVYPSKFDKQILNGSINRHYTGVVKFKNPFQISLKVEVQLLTKETSHKVFKLLSKQRKLTVAPLSTVEIPFSFSPRLIASYTAEIIIKRDHYLKWQFPLEVRYVILVFIFTGNYRISLT